MNNTETKERVAELYLEGNTQREIATQLGITPGRVERILEKAQDDWKKPAMRTVLEQRAVELARLAQIESEARKEWDRSKLPKQTTMKQKQTGQSGDGKPASDKLQVQTTETGQTGDPRYLAEIQKCIDARAKLLGLYAPKKIDLKMEEQREMAAILVAFVGELAPRQDGDREGAPAPVG